MAEYIVGKGGQFGTPAAAAKAAAAGDVMTILPGTYREALTLGTPRVEWRAAEAGTVIIDGSWDGKTTTDKFPTQVGVQAAGVVLRGLTINNCQGRAIGVSASDVRLLDCQINRTYHGAINLKGGDTPETMIRNLEVRGCIMTDTSLSWITEKQPKGVNGCFNIHGVADSLIIGNIARKGWGEGFNVGRGSTRLEIEGNEIYSMNHVLAYLNRCTDCELVGNLLFHLPDPTYAPKGKVSVGIRIGDERGRIVAKYPHSRGNRITRNVVVGTGVLLQVSNNRKETGGFDTQLLDTIVEGNTFVAGPGTRGGISVQQNQRGRPHQNSVFRENVIEFSNAQAGADIGTFGSGGGVEFARNVWSHEPPRTMRGEGDVYGDVRLVAPAAVINYTETGTDINPDNYRPWWNSPAVGDGYFVGALPPFGEAEPPDEPEPPPPVEPDIGEEALVELRVLREKVLMVLVAGESALGKADELIALLEAEQ